MAARKTLSATRLIAAKRESLRNLSKEVRAIEQNADSIRAVLALTAPFEKMADYTYGYAEGSWGELGVYVTARFRVSSLKSERVADILSRAEALEGFNTSSRDYVGEEFAQREFSYEGKVGAIRARLTLSFDLPTDGEACRRVQVGTDVREVPKYEIQCA